MDILGESEKENAYVGKTYRIHSCFSTHQFLELQIEIIMFWLSLTSFLFTLTNKMGNLHYFVNGVTNLIW